MSTRHRTTAVAAAVALAFTGFAAPSAAQTIPDYEPFAQENDAIDGYRLPDQRPATGGGVLEYEPFAQANDAIDGYRLEPARDGDPTLRETAADLLGVTPSEIDETAADLREELEGLLDGS